MIGSQMIFNQFMKTQIGILNLAKRMLGLIGRQKNFLNYVLNSNLLLRFLGSLTANLQIDTIFFLLIFKLIKNQTKTDLQIYIQKKVKIKY